MRERGPSIAILCGILGVLACSAPSRPAPRQAPPTEAAKPPEPAAPEDPLRAQLNLDFEQVDDGKIRGWSANTAVPEAAMTDPSAHHGAASLKLGRGDQPFTAASTNLDATAYRGKRVHLHGWIRTRGVAQPSWAGLWLRVDGGSRMAFDNMQDRPITGADAWVAATATVDVPDDGKTLVIGALLVGGGTAWIDDLRLEVGEIPPRVDIAIEGIVRGPDGAPAAGAHVALAEAPSSSAPVTTIAGPDGRFRFTAPTGRYTLSAHHPAGVGTFTEPRELTAPTADYVLALERDGGVTVRGRLEGGAPPAGAAVEVLRLSQHEGDGWVLPLAADGTFTAVLPRGDQYLAAIRGVGLRTELTARRGDAVDLVLDARSLAPAPPAVAAWIRKQAIPITTAEPGSGTADLRKLRGAIGKARLVALGEATHGTREFFQLKHRLVEYLVSELGFTVFAIEANLPECRAINAYVVDGQGDARTALAGIYFWTWNTEEVLAMIEWMRAWNADPRHPRKVRFVGFDMQTTTVAYATVAAFVRARTPADADALLAPLAPYGARGRPPEGAALEAIGNGLSALSARFAGDAAAWRSADPAGYVLARQDLRVLEQAHAMHRAEGTGSNGMGGYDARDRAMADNVDWLLAQEPKGTRMVLWAHNGHVARKRGSGMITMGSHLAQRHGRDYHVLGFGFGEGAFQAMDWTGGRNQGLRDHTVGPAPAWDVSTPFTAAGPIVAVDLRAARGPVKAWLAAPHATRELGAVYSGEDNLTSPLALAEQYDTVIFVAKTTAARKLAN